MFPALLDSIRALLETKHVPLVLRMPLAVRRTLLAILDLLVMELPAKHVVQQHTSHWLETAIAQFVLRMQSATRLRLLAMLDSTNRLRLVKFVLPVTIIQRPVLLFVFKRLLILLVPPQILPATLVSLAAVLLVLRVLQVTPRTLL